MSWIDLYNREPRPGDRVLVADASTAKGGRLPEVLVITWPVSYRGRSVSWSPPWESYRLLSPDLLSPVVSPPVPTYHATHWRPVPEAT